MSLQRNLRRQERKGGTKDGLAGLANPLAQLQEALGEIKKVSDLGQTAQGVEAIAVKLKEAGALVQELTQLRDELRARPKEDRYLVELEKQRAVFLRFLLGSDVLLTTHDRHERFLAVEQRYREEYDAMRFLVRILTWVKEDSKP